MKMVKIFTIPFSKSSETFFEDDLNQFLLNKKVNSIKAEFFKNRENFYWTVFIDCKGYGKKKIEKYGDDVLKIVSGFLQ